MSDSKSTRGNPELGDAQLVFTIEVQKSDGGEPEFTTIINPGNVAWGHDQVARVFKITGLTQRVGRYTFECSLGDGFRTTELPEGIIPGERRTIQNAIQNAITLELYTFLSELLSAHDYFPTDQVIGEVARQVVEEVIRGSLARHPLEVAPVYDPSTMAVEAVECISCGFSTNLAEFLSGKVDIFGATLEAFRHGGIQKINGVHYRILDHDRVPVLRVGYLAHENIFATFFNSILAKKVAVEIVRVTPEVVRRMLAFNELQRRMLMRMIESVKRTFPIDHKEIVALADEIEDQITESAKADGE